MREFYNQRNLFQVVSELDLTVRNSDIESTYLKISDLFVLMSVYIEHQNVLYKFDILSNFLKNLLECLWLGTSTHEGGLGKPIPIT